MIRVLLVLLGALPLSRIHAADTTGGAAANDRSSKLAPAVLQPRPSLPAVTAAVGWDGSRLAGTGSPALPFTTQPVFPGLKFRLPVSILSVPTASAAEPERLLVVEVDGAVSTFLNRPDVREREPMLNLPAHFRQATQTYQVAFHPRYPSIPDIFVYYNRQQPKPAENVVARFTVSRASPPVADLASERVIMRWPSDGHNGGDLKFGPDGFLYVSTGDRSQPGDPANLGQRVDLIVGGVLRLDIDRPSPGQHYAVPSDNPFVGLPDVRPEYWAYGLRNPWRMSFGPTGELWLGDNGDDSWESIHLVRKGHNYGWSVFEGSHPFKRSLALAGPTPRLTPPVVELPHSEARSAVGGLVYAGDALPGLKGHYIFGDYVTGFLWAFRWDAGAGRRQDFRRIADTRGGPLGFGSTRAGDVLMAWGDGQIRQLVPASVQSKGPARAVPARLSETGLFSSTRDLTPAPGVEPYALNAPLWSDGAVARRHFALPAAARIGFHETASWQVPDGAALVRTLEWPDPRGPQRVETQVMHREQSQWQFYTYAWNAAQTDADLVPAEGGERPVTADVPDRRWTFASRGECTVCHTAQTDFVLGLTTAQLNRDLDRSAPNRATENQIVALAASGRLDGAPAAPPHELPRLVDPALDTAPLETRARAYLSANCAHCHRPDGVGGRAAFQLMVSLPLAKTGLVQGRPLVPLLGPEAKLIAPGAPERSELIHRMTMSTGGRMPLLGSRVRDEAGVELLRQWILQLP